MGCSGSGKTYSALAIASGLGKRVAVIDTERGSASLYAGQFQFDVCELQSFHPEKYIQAIEDAGGAGYDVIVIDSLSHAWMGKDGALELVDSAAKRAKASNSFAAWREVTPLHNRLVEAILQSKAHVIITMRSKTEYVLEDNDRGRKVPRKVGLAPIQRDGLEYEFTVVGELDLEHNLVITKSRCDALDNRVIQRPGAPLARQLLTWLTGAKEAPASAAAATPSQPPRAPEPAGCVDVDDFVRAFAAAADSTMIERLAGRAQGIGFFGESRATIAAAYRAACARVGYDPHAARPTPTPAPPAAAPPAAAPAEREPGSDDEGAPSGEDERGEMLASLLSAESLEALADLARQVKALALPEGHPRLAALREAHRRRREELATRAAPPRPALGPQVDHYDPAAEVTRGLEGGAS